jgi:transcription elongation factor Elf1
MTEAIKPIPATLTRRGIAPLYVRKIEARWIEDDDPMVDCPRCQHTLMIRKADTEITCGICGENYGVKVGD